MMKILHVGPVYHNRAGGPSRSVVGLAMGQIAMGCRIGLLPSQPTEPLTKEDVPKEIILLPNPQKLHRNPWWISKKWIKIIKETFGAPDLVNFHDTFVPFHTALANLIKKEGWPYIVTPRGPLSYRALQIKPLKKKIGRLLFLDRYIKNSKAIHALCENEAKDIRKIYPGHKVFIAHNGVDQGLIDLSNKLTPMELNGFRQNNDLVIGFIGRIDIYHKGIDLLLSALKLLQEKGAAPNIKLLMVGPFHSAHDEKQVKMLIDSLKFPERVKIIGPAFGETKWRLLKACDVFVHSSRLEGLPMSVLEAMAFSKPCLVTPGSNMQDIVSASGGGWLCEESPDSIAQTMAQIQKEEIVTRGAKARIYVEKYLSWPEVARQYLEEIKKL